MRVRVSVQVREHTSHLEAELEKHMVAASAECQNYAKEVAGVSLPMGSPAAGRFSPALGSHSPERGVWVLRLWPWPRAS